jgi:hypothetical protein
VRHIAGAPDRRLDEVVLVLAEYAEDWAQPVQAAITSAQEKRLDDVDKFLGERFGKRVIADIKAIHELEEQRPIDTLWDVTTAVTAYAGNVPHQDRRIDLGREAGKVLQLAA